METSYKKISDSIIEVTKTETIQINIEALTSKKKSLQDSIDSTNASKQAEIDQAVQEISATYESTLNSLTKQIEAIDIQLSEFNKVK